LEGGTKDEMRIFEALFKGFSNSERLVRPSKIFVWEGKNIFNGACIKERGTCKTRKNPKASFEELSLTPNENGRVQRV